MFHRGRYIRGQDRGSGVRGGRAGLTGMRESGGAAVTGSDAVAVIHAANVAYLEAYRRNARLMALLEQVATVNERLAELRLERSAAFLARNARASRRLQRAGPGVRAGRLTAGGRFQAGGQGAWIRRSMSSPNGRSPSMGPTITVIQSSSIRQPGGGGRSESAAAW